LDDEKGQEFSRYTLLGEWDAFFIALLRERLIHDGLDPEKDLMPQFKAHLNRGVIMLFSRIKDLSDVYDLIPNTSKHYKIHRTMGTMQDYNSQSSLADEN
jgi:DNA sulfur modification protein DndE